jgi:ribonuclease Z
MQDKVREHYKGPLAMATDFMVVNVTKDEIVTRMTEISDHVWPNKSKHEGFGKAKRKKMTELSPWLKEAQIFPKVPSKRGLVNADEVDD